MHLHIYELKITILKYLFTYFYLYIYIYLNKCKYIYIYIYICMINLYVYRQLEKSIAFSCEVLPSGKLHPDCWTTDGNAVAKVICFPGYGFSSPDHIPSVGPDRIPSLHDIALRCQVGGQRINPTFTTHGFPFGGWWIYMALPHDYEQCLKENSRFRCSAWKVWSDKAQLSELR